MEKVSAHILLEHYKKLLVLYEQLESVSLEVYDGLVSGIKANEIATLLKESARFAEQIGATSKTIVSLKKQCVERGILDDSDRCHVHETEKRLAEIVSRLVDQENRNRDLVSSRGVKISRR